MSLAQELRDREWLITDHINDALRNHSIEEVAQYIRSSEDFERINLNFPPVNEEVGRHISDAIVQNAHIKTLDFIDRSGAIRDLVTWIESHNTLVNMTNLECVEVMVWNDMSVLDCSALFPLLLTSTSLRKFYIRCFRDNECRCSEDVISALSSYLSAASLREFHSVTLRLSEAAFTSLCNGVALSTVKHVTLEERALQNFDLETAAESLAQMIVESSLEEVTIGGWLPEWIEIERLISALQLTAPVRNMDFAFTHVVDNHISMDFVCRARLRINRKWKPLILSANTPLALWPHILEKSHVFPETSHGSADIVFYVLRQKPDLVPAP
jgi:hypothetical protein